MKRFLSFLLFLLAITAGAQDTKTIPLPEKFYDIETSPNQPYLLMLTRSTYGDKAVEIRWLDGECRTQHRIRTDATLLKSNGGKFYLQKGDKLVIADWEGLKTLY